MGHFHLLLPQILKQMKKLTLLLTAVLAISVSAYCQINTPPVSPGQTIHQAFGLAAIDLSYSRPGIKGRKIFGDLVPYGKVWRTGANGATTLTFGDDVIIGETKIAPGKYGLVTIPGKDEWTIIITKQTDITNPAAYKPENDVVKIMAKPATIGHAVETFTMQFDDIMPTSCTLWMTWENTAVPLRIKTDIDAKVMAQIDTAIVGKNPPYYAAAGYYFGAGKDLAKAEGWAKKATEANPDAYFMFYLLAEIQEKLGKKAEAIATANKSIELAKKAPNADYVALNEKLIKRLQ
jgi:hypothetical protein